MQLFLCLLVCEVMRLNARKLLSFISANRADWNSVLICDAIGYKTRVERQGNRLRFVCTRHRTVLQIFSQPTFNLFSHVCVWDVPANTWSDKRRSTECGTTASQLCWRWEFPSTLWLRRRHDEGTSFFHSTQHHRHGPHVTDCLFLLRRAGFFHPGFCKSAPQKTTAVTHAVA